MPPHLTIRNLNTVYSTNKQNQIQDFNTNIVELWYLYFTHYTFVLRLTKYHLPVTKYL